MFKGGGRAADAAQKRLDQLLAWQADPKTLDREDAEYKDWCSRHDGEPVTKFLSSRVHRAKAAVKKGGEPKVKKGKEPGKNRVDGGNVDPKRFRPCQFTAGRPAGGPYRNARFLQPPDRVDGFCEILLIQRNEPNAVGEAEVRFVLDDSDNWLETTKPVAKPQDDIAEFGFEDGGSILF